ncbi:MAG: tRNA (adenosine(37)-N6)-threonylcarbamoyltransferase complex ATPase subunit type 1 TsaE [Chloroflexi bacterium]|nr:tRNA (adenosine(37)-N6)-threonylcarbamoyltransferase complex ATPase subunit type 1 TsaE [Chloroflexota bacterium]
MNHPPIGLTERPTHTQLRLTTHGPEETVALGRRIGQAIQSNLFIALSGDLGAGKTTFTAGLAAGLGIPVPVTSPTFTLVNDYTFDKLSTSATGRGAQARRLAHMDVYRLEGSSAAELDGIGFGDLLDDLEAADDCGLLVLVMEWADRLGPLLPEERLDVTSVSDEEDPDVRVFTLTARGETATALLQRLAEA